MWPPGDEQQKTNLSLLPQKIQLRVHFPKERGGSPYEFPFPHSWVARANSLESFSPLKPKEKEELFFFFFKFHSEKCVTSQQVTLLVSDF